MLNQTNQLQNRIDTGFAPIGLDMPYRVFISEDPIGFKGGEVNFFVYVGNSPMNWIDPLGLDRYNPCEGLSGPLLDACEEYVDWGCSGARNIICCEAEKTECLDNAFPGGCSDGGDEGGDTETKVAKCFQEYTKCISNTNQ